MSRKVGRPPLPRDGATIRRLVLVATDDEWEALLAALPVDSRERALYILNAATGYSKNKAESLALQFAQAEAARYIGDGVIAVAKEDAE